jgi:cell division protein FtsB
MNEPDHDPQDDHHRRRVNLIAAAFIALILLGAWYVFDGFTRNEALQKCISLGRHDCAPLDLSATGQPPKAK